MYKLYFDMEKYLKELVEHELWTYFKKYCSNPRQAMILLWWVALNSMWDFLWNEDAKFEKKNVKIDDIYLTWTSPDINEITIDICNRDVKKLRELIKKDLKIKEKLEKCASFWNETILLIDLWDWKYKSFDWMHRIVWHILLWKSEIDAYVLKNYWEFLPNNEPHVVYDIIKSYQRSKRNKQDKDDLKWALRLLINNTWNTKELLMNRFNSNYLKDNEIQEIIKELIV